MSREGEPLSFQGSHQRILLSLLLEKALVIPVTARNMESFKRVHLNFTQGAILSYGAVILDPLGQVDETWREIIWPKAKRDKQFLRSVLNLANSLVKKESLAARVRLVSDFGLDFYLMAKTEPDKLPELTFLATQLAERFEAKVFLNGNNLAFLPGWLDKGVAAQYFLDNHTPLPARSSSERLILGLGDSLADLGFLALCDYIMTPNQSQLAQLFGTTEK
jgi:hypothetical protein